MSLSYSCSTPTPSYASSAVSDLGSAPTSVESSPCLSPVSPVSTASESEISPVSSYVALAKPNLTSRGSPSGSPYAALGLDPATLAQAFGSQFELIDRAKVDINQSEAFYLLPTATYKSVNSNKNRSSNKNNRNNYKNYKHSQKFQSAKTQQLNQGSAFSHNGNNNINNNNYNNNHNYNNSNYNSNNYNHINNINNNINNINNNGFNYIYKYTPPSIQLPMLQTSITEESSFFSKPNGQSKFFDTKTFKSPLPGTGVW